MKQETCLQSMRRSLDALFTKEVARGRLGGASLAVQWRGARIATAHWGTDAPDLRYRVFSLTKLVTALAAMLLIERGMLAPSDPVSRYLPAYANLNRIDESGKLCPVARVLTVFDLMNMTSGLVYPNAAGTPAERAAAQVESELRARLSEGWRPGTAEFMEAYARAPLAFEPGADYRYGTSADVLGAVVERACGESAEAFLTREVLQPLQMQDTAFCLPEQERGRLASMYTRESGGRVVPSPAMLDSLLYVPPTPEEQRSFVSCGAGLYSTLEDLMRLADCLLTGSPLLARHTLDFMRQNRLTPAQLQSFRVPGFEGYGYGCLMRVLMEPAAQHTAARPGEYGWEGLPGCYLMADPNEALTLVYMQQILEGPDRSLWRRMRNIVYDAITGNR